MKTVLSLPNFRLLLAGTATSLLGNQFTLIAIPWLALQATSDPLALGSILALESIARAAFMLFGGAITDRFHARRVMIATDLLSFVLTGLMALCVFTGVAQIWMLYAFGICFGVLSGIAIPATNSIVPTLVEESDLEAGNAIIMGATQLAMFIGPTLAGVLIGQLAQSTFGIGVAFAVDSLTFALSAYFLWRIRAEHSSAQTKDNLVQAVLSGARFAWHDPVLRSLILVLTAANFFLMGPLTVGIPLLADSRLPLGATAFGLLMSAFAGGNLLGYAAAGTLKRPSGALLRSIILAFIASFGLFLVAIGYSTSLWLDFALMLLLGVGNGYLAILLFTWMQTRTPKVMLGRMMSLLMFGNAAFVPLSQAISGVVGAFDLTLLFLIAGVFVMIVALVAGARSELHSLSASMAAQE